VLTYLLAIIAAVPVGIVVASYGRHNPPFWVTAMGYVTEFISGCLAGPFLTIAMSLVYYDQRVRKEGFDLQLMLAAVDGAPAPSQGAAAAPSFGQ